MRKGPSQQTSRDTRTPEERKADNRRKHAQRRKELKALGICWNCTKPAAPGRTMCEAHAELTRRNGKKYRDKKRSEPKQAKAS